MSLLTQLIEMGQKRDWVTDSESLPEFVRICYFIPKLSDPKHECSVTFIVDKHSHLIKAVLDTRIHAGPWEGVKEELLFLLKPHLSLLYYSQTNGNISLQLQHPTDDLDRLEEFVDTALVCAQQIQQAIDLAIKAVHDYALSRQ